MKDIYIISTIHHKWNLAFNKRLCEALEKHGISVHLPQRDTNQKAQPKVKFSQNMKAMKSSRKIIAVAENETPNWGAEVGYCHGRGKKVIAITNEDHFIPLMASGMMDKIIRAKNLENLDYIEKLIKTIKKK